jgi:hypothetical protein
MPPRALHTGHLARPALRWLWLCVLACTLALPATAARADACTVLLCLAGNWRSIGQCVPPVRRALRDLALGRSLAICDFASPPADASLIPATAAAPARAVLVWASEGHCPVQYRTHIELESGSSYACGYAGAIEVSVGGQVWNRTWWNLSGDTVTEWSEAARRRLPQAQHDDRFEREYQAWRAAQSEVSGEPAPTVPEGGA